MGVHLITISIPLVGLCQRFSDCQEASARPLEVSMLPNKAVGLLYIRVPRRWVPVSKLLIWKDFYNWHKRCLELSVP